MREEKKQFISELADVIDALRSGRKQPPRNPLGRVHGQSSKHLDIGRQLTRTNKALAAGRACGILPRKMPMLSRAKKSSITEELRSYRAIGAVQIIRDRTLQAFQEMGVPKDLLLEIDSAVDQIKSVSEAGT